MKTTEKLMLEKPLYDDIADIMKINTNMDKIDNAFGRLDSGKLDKDELPNFEHFIKMIVSEEGVHGLRYFGNVLQVYIDGSWIAVSSKDDGLREQVNKNTADIKVMWDAIFNDITTNPFSITFQDLNGITLKSGVWNKPQVRLEC